MTRDRRLSRRLRPGPGHRLPRELRPRHVAKRARGLPGGLSGPALPELLSRIDGGGTVHRGHRLELFMEGRQAMAAMLEAAAQARHEILLESYIFHHDRTGRRFLEVLAAAAERGIAVRVLADAFGSWRTRAEFWAEMRDRGVAVHLFHRLFPYLWWQPFRDHRKLLVVDRQVAFTGGMNIGDEYTWGPGAGGPPWRDTQLRLEGPAAAEMAAVFSEAWERAGGSVLETVPGGQSFGTAAQVLVLESRPGRGHRETVAVLAAIVAAARRSVWLTNAYFAPSRLARSMLGEAARRGLDVRLLLPGVTDQPLVRRAGRGRYGELLACGVRVFEYQPTVLHAKTLVADGMVSVVGSTNLDFRSFQFNAECNLVIIDPDVGQTLAGAFERDQALSEEIRPAAWRRRPWRDRVIETVARGLSPLL